MSIRRAPRFSSATMRYGDRFGQYVINGFAGVGATSYVYKARRGESFDAVAIKVLHPELLGDEVKRRRFVREAEVMMQMDHPNVVRLEEIQYGERSLAIVMEYVEGMTLAQWRKRWHGRLDEHTLASVFVDVLRGLAHAHRKGIVHRDLKPANIMLTQRDGQLRAKIIDFGVARLMDHPLEREDRDKIVGTAAYISPEEIQDPEQLCPASDLYSLGVMLYEAACGRRPFEEGEGVEALLSAHLGEVPRAPRQLNPRLTSAMESVILRTLRKEPGDRFDEASQMIRALE
ncbi:MAG: serine/threonine-protein kinase, partial [Myxococcota bacterium]